MLVEVFPGLLEPGPGALSEGTVVGSGGRAAGSAVTGDHRPARVSGCLGDVLVVACHLPFCVHRRATSSFRAPVQRSQPVKWYRDVEFETPQGAVAVPVKPCHRSTFTAAIRSAP